MRLVPAAAVAWAITAAGVRWPIGPVLAAGCLLLAVATLLVRPRVVGAAVVGVACVGAGFGVAVTMRADAVRAHPIAQQSGRVTDVTLVPTESPRSLGSGRLLIRADLRQVGQDPTRGRVVVFAPVLDFHAAAVGRPMRFPARIGRATRHDLTVATLNATGPPQFGRTSAIQRAAGAVRDRFALRAREVLPSGQAAMLPALVLGDTSAVTPVVTEQFRAAGLTHLTAVSGANVTIVCGAVLLAGSLIGPRTAVGLAALALVAFVIVVQPTASVLRAAVMGAITLLGLLTARRRQAIPALAASVLALMIAAPQLAVDAGFALSVAATAALVVLAPVWSRRLTARGWPKPVADAVCLALAANLVTAPLIAGISGRLSLVAVLANLAVSAVIAPITVLGTAAAVLAPWWPGAATLLIRFTGPQLWWLLHVAGWAGGSPHAAVSVPSGFAGVALVALGAVATVLLWRVRWFRIGAGCGGVLAVAWVLAGFG
ncbi:ComEC/Rec2 family competence protein [Mycobacterium sp. ACS4331]|uniref:ComEC/Rec2 family competence protein n=1 Tax=Mycobacterium sp. ACS4331 TaxID=1834121 RepID=UPI0007FCD70B|nr:ComEC/Rec2 family competence protein [Mycobacterium sp. ACS4331]OBF14682.1 competence protein [Mycobacterium sp. ACS4331]